MVAEVSKTTDGFGQFDPDSGKSSTRARMYVLPDNPSKLSKLSVKGSEVLVIPWQHVQHDNHRVMPVRGRLIMSPGYRAAKHAARVILSSQWRAAMLTGELALHARCWFPDKRKRDAGNYRKLVTDCLTGVAYTDDSQLVSETWERAGFDRENPRIELTLTPAGGRHGVAKGNGVIQASEED